MFWMFPVGILQDLKKLCEYVDTKYPEVTRSTSADGEGNHRRDRTDLSKGNHKSCKAQFKRIRQKGGERSMASMREHQEGRKKQFRVHEQITESHEAGVHR